MRNWQLHLQPLKQCFRAHNLLKMNNGFTVRGSVWRLHLVGAGVTAIDWLQLVGEDGRRFPCPHIPSDHCASQCTLTCGPARMCQCRQIHFGGMSKKSTHGHTNQCRLIACTIMLGAPSERMVHSKSKRSTVSPHQLVTLVLPTFPNLFQQLNSFTAFEPSSTNAYCPGKYTSRPYY